MNALLGYAIYALFTLLGIGPTVALILTYIVAVPINYLTTGKLVFNVRNLAVLTRFITSYVIVYFANLLMLTILISNDFSQLSAQAVAVPFMAILSFLIFKYAVFKKN